jgi:hypothetical protein
MNTAPITHRSPPTLTREELHHLAQTSEEVVFRLALGGVLALARTWGALAHAAHALEPHRARDEMSAYPFFWRDEEHHDKR